METTHAQGSLADSSTMQVGQGSCAVGRAQVPQALLQGTFQASGQVHCHLVQIIQSGSAITMR